MYSKESLLYWKKVYLLLGQEFSHDDWSGESFEDDGYDPKIHGHPYQTRFYFGGTNSNDNLNKWIEIMPNTIDQLTNWTIYRFTDQFLEDINND